VAWVIAKIAGAVGARLVGLPLFAFRPTGELIACCWEVAAVYLALRLRREHIYLNHLGLGLGHLLLPFVLLHFMVDLALSAVAR
jgi:hypothetical protein